MNDIEGPWLNLAEAAQRMKMFESELVHHIEQGRIDAYLYASSRAFVALSMDNGAWIGHATFTYSGYIRVTTKNILLLVNDGAQILGHSACTLVTPAAVEHWSSQNPYKATYPNSFLASWKPLQSQTKSLWPALAIPKPIEHESVRSGLGKLTQIFEATAAGRTVPEYGEMDTTYAYDFSRANRFTPAEIRVPLEALEAFTAPRATTSNTHPPTDPDLLKQFLMAGSSRENQLHAIIKRIVYSDPKIKTRAAWQLIRQEASLDERTLDIDHILTKVDADCIEWTSRHENDNSMTYKSFTPRLSAVKKELKTLKSNK
jgi:hypothetical protein